MIKIIVKEKYPHFFQNQINSHGVKKLCVAPRPNDSVRPNKYMDEPAKHIYNTGTSSK